MDPVFYKHITANLWLSHHILCRMINSSVIWDDWSEELQRTLTELMVYFAEKEGISMEVKATLHPFSRAESCPQLCECGGWKPQRLPAIPHARF